MRNQSRHLAWTLGVSLTAIASVHAHEGHEPELVQREQARTQIALAQPPATPQPAAPPKGISGDGQWKFRVAKQYRLPDDARDKILGAHGGFAVDPKTHNLYFGLKGVGIVRLGPKPGDTEILHEFPELTAGNLHNVTFFAVGDRIYLACPDNEQHKVLVVNRTDNQIRVLNRPESNDYYRSGGAFNPTDTEYLNHVLYVADGYSPGNFVTMADPFKGSWLPGVFGGKGTEHGQFNTCHGITYNPVTKTIDISDRPNSRIERYDADGKYLSTVSMPEGSWPVDVDYYGELGLAGCLYGPGKSSPAPIFIFDAQGKILSTIKPKEDFGIPNATHVHNASWWILPPERAGQSDRVFIAVTCWNPGDFFILERVNN